jgi:CheY-like chemotaxis protein
MNIINQEQKVSPQNIFVLDDNPDDLKLIGNILKREFPEALLLVTETKDQLMKQLSWVKPDIIISDFRLRSCNGLDVLIEVREKSDVPFVFCTSALNSHNELSDSILKGANGYVLKDEIHELPQVVSKVINNHASQVRDRIDRDKLICNIKYTLQKLEIKIQEKLGVSESKEILQIIQDLDKLK